MQLGGEEEGEKIKLSLDKAWEASRKQWIDQMQHPSGFSELTHVRDASRNWIVGEELCQRVGSVQNDCAWRQNISQITQQRQINSQIQLYDKLEDMHVQVNCAK